MKDELMCNQTVAHCGGSRFDSSSIVIFTDQCEIAGARAANRSSRSAMQPEHVITEDMTSAGVGARKCRPRLDLDRHADGT
jgi:hypothetical protein